MLIEISLIFIDFHWFSLNFHWCSLIFNVFSWIFMDFQWFSRRTGPVLDGLRQPSIPLGSLGVDVKRWKSNVSRGASSKNRTSVPTPSGPLGPPRAPSAAIGALWVGVKRRYGSPPSNSPDFLFVIYKVEVVGVVGCSHTPEESADSNK